MTLTHGSLFSGIGGFDLGFERAGIRTLWQVEIDAYCRRVLEKRFPHAKRHSDVRTAGKHNLEWVDIISGGFPCQDISNAGKRAGIDGERSGLWSEYARIICELRPRYVVVENVAALLGRGIERVLGDLAEIGYDAEWQSIRALDLGAPHIRERIWIVAYPGSERRQQISGGTHGDEGANERRTAAQAHIFTGNGQGRGTEHFPDTTRNLRRTSGNEIIDASDWARANVANPDSRGQSMQGESSRSSGLFARSGETLADAECESAGRRYNGLERRQRSTQESTRDGWTGRGFENDWWATEPDVGRVAHGIPARVDRLRGLGNAIVPQIAEWIGERIIQAHVP